MRFRFAIAMSITRTFHRSSKFDEFRVAYFYLATTVDTIDRYYGFEFKNNKKSNEELKRREREGQKERALSTFQQLSIRISAFMIVLLMPRR